VKVLLWLILMAGAISSSCSTTAPAGQEETLAKMDQRPEVSGGLEEQVDLSTQQVAVPSPFEENGKWGYLNGSGQVVITPRYMMAGDFSAEGLAAVADQQKWVYIDRMGRTVIEPYIFDNGPDYFAEDLARFIHDGKFGFFDKTGRVVIDPQFDFARPFSGGRAAVCTGGEEVLKGEHRVWEGGRWGYIDKRGLLVIPVKFEAAGEFQEGRAEVIVRGEQREIDAQGEFIR